MKDKLEVAEKIVGLFGKFGIILGSVILLYYCKLIGYLPKEISIGDGLLFIFLAVGFGGVYLFFATCIAGLGLLLGPIWRRLQSIGMRVGRKYCSIRRRAYNYRPFEVLPIRGEYLLFGIFGGLFVFLFAMQNLWVLPRLLLASFVSAFVLYLYRSNSLLVKKIDAEQTPTDEDRDKRERVRKVQSFLPLILLVTPLVIGGIQSDLIIGAMRLLNIRKDAVTVHLKKPYTILAQEHGVVGTKSNFGDDFLQYPRSKVLLNGFGQNVVLSLRV